MAAVTGVKGIAPISEIAEVTSVKGIAPNELCKQLDEIQNKVAETTGNTCTCYFTTQSIITYH